MRRYKYKSIDCFAHYPYKYSTQAKQYQHLTKQDLEKGPSTELIKWRMARILLEHDGKLGGHKKNTMKTAWVKATKSLRECRSKWSDMEKELHEDLGNQALKEWWTQAKATSVNRFKDHFRQCDHDSVAAADPTILEMVADQDLVLVLDKSNELIAFCATKAVQRLFSEGVLEKVYTCFDIYTYHQAIPKPDPTRHPLQVEFLRESPRFDCRAEEDRKLAKCGVEHYGCREMTGHPHARILYMANGSLATRYFRSDNLARSVYPKFKRGA